MHEYNICNLISFYSKKCFRDHSKSAQIAKNWNMIQCILEQIQATYFFAYPIIHMQTHSESKNFSKLLLLQSSHFFACFNKKNSHILQSYPVSKWWRDHYLGEFIFHLVYFTIDVVFMFGLFCFFGIVCWFKTLIWRIVDKWNEIMEKKSQK